jgi:hypothetical protein
MSKMLACMGQWIHVSRSGVECLDAMQTQTLAYSSKS